jgi:hypothetical protein
MTTPGRLLLVGTVLAANQSPPLSACELISVPQDPKETFAQARGVFVAKAIAVNEFQAYLEVLEVYKGKIGPAVVLPQLSNCLWGIKQDHTYFLFGEPDAYGQLAGPEIVEPDPDVANSPELAAWIRSHKRIKIQSHPKPEPIRDTGPQPSGAERPSSP